MVDTVNVSGSHKWNQPCSVTIKLHDVDQAYQLASALEDLLYASQGGGDFSLIGEINGETTSPQFVGHDIAFKGIELKIGE
jgi:hypothetical protein